MADKGRLPGFSGFDPLPSETTVVSFLGSCHVLPPPFSNPAPFFRHFCRLPLVSLIQLFPFPGKKFSFHLLVEWVFTVFLLTSPPKVFSFNSHSPWQTPPTESRFFFQLNSRVAPTSFLRSPPLGSQASVFFGFEVQVALWPPIYELLFFFFLLGVIRRRPRLECPRRPTAFLGGHL